MTTGNKEKRESRRLNWQKKKKLKERGKNKPKLGIEVKWRGSSTVHRRWIKVWKIVQTKSEEKRV
jgi:hypothetical protein